MTVWSLRGRGQTWGLYYSSFGDPVFDPNRRVVKVIARGDAGHVIILEGFPIHVEEQS